MTEQEIRDHLDRLNKLVGTWHNQINDIAAREAAAAIVQSPLPYSNPALTVVKDQLIERSGQVIEQMKDLHDKLMAGPSNGVVA